VRLEFLFAISALGVLVGLYSAYLSAQQPAPQPPVFSPAPDPYANGIYATGIIESHQSHGANIAINPEVAGPITAVLVAEGDSVKAGAPLLTIDDSVQRQTTAQLRAQAEAAGALLAELKVEPRPETLDVAVAQVANAKASLKSAADTLAKQERSFALDPQSVSRDVLDTARNSAKMAETNLKVVERQEALTRAGAWSYDIENQERNYAALSKAADAADALLKKYTIRAPRDGVVLAIEAAAGSYVSSSGAYDAYTQGMLPLIVMGSAAGDFEVRCYIDEILINRLPPTAKMSAKMYVQGTNINMPLTYERMQPYVSPKIELSDQRLEQVDVRVLPVIFRFQKPADVTLYQGQLVDVYIGEAPAASVAALGMAAP
jgi:HlyD family secretion protein